jgi:hypothetical protein
MGFTDFVGRVADPFRGASPTPKTARVSGGGYQSEYPAVAGWLEKNPEVGDALGRVQSAVAALEGAHEGALNAFDKAREKFDEAKANESRAHYDARESGRSVDPELAKRLLRARQTGNAGSEEAAVRAATASNNFAATRDALNVAVRFAGHLAGERSGVVMAEPVKLPSDVAPNVIVADRRQALVDLDVEIAAVKSAPVPVEDAVAAIRASVGGEAPRIVLTERSAEWLPPQQRLNVEARLGDQPIDVDNTTALLSWLFSDVLGDRLEELVRAKYIGVERTYSLAERRKALTDLAARRLTVERVEVAAVFAAWEDGLYVPLRRDVSPLALLGIERVTEGAKDPEGYTGSAPVGVIQR